MKGDSIMKMAFAVTTANVLAPIHKRIDKEGTRESEKEALYLARHKEVIEHILRDKEHLPAGVPDVICLQEFWVQGEKCKSLYKHELCEKRGYRLLELERTNNRGDGVASFVGPRLKVVDSRKILFYDCGDRVGLLLWLRVMDDEAATPVGGGEGESCDMLLVNTHLLFPHNLYSTNIRLREMCKILGFIDKFKKDNELGPLPIFLTGDLNGSPSGQVANFLRERGFVSAFEAHNSVNAPHKLKQWISHRSHRNQYVGVDYIWHLPPQNQSLPLGSDWRKMVFQEIHKELPRAVRDAFAVFDSDDNKFIDPAEFKSTLKSLGFTGEGRPALTDDEIEYLFQQADRGEDGLIDFKDFVDRFWELDLYQNEFGNYVPELQPAGITTPEIEVRGRPFEPMTADEEERFFLGKTTSLDNARYELV